ncbi:MAG: Smg family protein [Steroidobacteraceae bacterium]
MTTGSVLKVLIYVYDHYMLADPAEVPERHRMLADLQKRGFSVSEVVQAMEWLSALVGEQRATPGSVEPERGRAGLRVFADGELARLSPDSRAFLMLLDRQHVLTPHQRELVIDRALALDVDEVDVEQLKWVVLLVLSSQPGQELAFARFESVMSAAGGTVRH